MSNFWGAVHIFLSFYSFLIVKHANSVSSVFSEAPNCCQVVFSSVQSKPLISHCWGFRTRYTFSDPLCNSNSGSSGDKHILHAYCKSCRGFGSAIVAVQYNYSNLCPGKFVNPRKFTGRVLA